MRLDLLVVKSPPEHFGRIPRMNRRIAHPAVDGILAHDDRHAGGCGHGRGASAVVVLSGIDDDLSRLHLLPCLPGRLRQSVVDRRAADCCAHRNCDVLDRDGRSRHQDFVLLHPRNHIDCRGYFRPDRTGLHKNLRHSLVGFLNLCSDIHVFPFLLRFRTVSSQPPCPYMIAQYRGCLPVLSRKNCRSDLLLCQTDSFCFPFFRYTKTVSAFLFRTPEMPTPRRRFPSPLPPPWPRPSSAALPASFALPPSSPYPGHRTSWKSHSGSIR